VLIVRGTKKLRDRVKGSLLVRDLESTTLLGDWFATALFWRPQVALLVNQRTFVPVFMELAPAATLLERAPVAIEAVLRLHGVDGAVVAAERDEMRDVRIAPTNDRSVVGVMNEFAFHGEVHWQDGLHDLDVLSMRMAGMPLGPLRGRSGFPDLELAAVLGDEARSATVIPLPSHRGDSKPVPTPKSGTSAFYLKVTLLGTKPPIWRRVVVAGSSTLDQVHEVIQAAFGWWNYHLHEFEIDGSRYGVPDPDEDWGEPRLDERSAQLAGVAAAGSSFRYTYDFGDDWRHQVVVEKVVLASTDLAVPACSDGRRSCLPEDCGGPWGYQQLLDILADLSHPEHDERVG
jgi:Plasmid pRiA4b ORF-3-like protein